MLAVIPAELRSDRVVRGDFAFVVVIGGAVTFTRPGLGPKSISSIFDSSFSLFITSSGVGMGCSVEDVEMITTGDEGEGEGDGDGEG